MREPMPTHAIAIIGMAGRFPQADTLDTFWRHIAGGVESLATLTDADLDAAGVPAALRAHPSYVRRGTFIEQADHFDAGFFGYAPREAQVIDPQQRLFLECAWEALEHAGYAPGALPESVGVYAGASMNSYVHTQLMRNPTLTEAVGGYQIMLGNDKDYLSTRVSYKLGLRGPSMTIQTACSTSLVAVQAACRALQRADCDMALAGGVSLTFPLGAGYLYQDGMILSPDGHCRPFDVDARGTRAGAGVGIVVLKRLAEALADGDTVHAVIRGIAINNDGAAKAGYTAPSVEGQVEVITMALALAGVSPRSIGYLEAHGTATPIGDPIEIAALTRAFRASTPDVGFCRLGSVKGNLGHLDAAAGVAGLIKAVLALSHRALPPLVNFRAPNPALALERSPFTASATGSAWTTDDDTPRRAGVSSFGIGGTNAHAVLEEAPPATERPTSHQAHLVVLSARSPGALAAACTRLVGHLDAHPEQDLADVAWTLQIGRRAFAHRCAIVASDRASVVAALREPLRAPVRTGWHEGGVRPVAFLFSGQGSQHAAMGRGLYESEPVYRDAVDRCAEILQPLLGDDIRGPLHADEGGDGLAATALAQPALFVTAFALATLWQDWGVRPQAMMGHSIGEYVAAHLAGVMSLADALTVVAARGRLMPRQATGTMAAVHLGPGDLQPWLTAGLEVAAVDSPGLCTVSGPPAAVETLVVRLGEAGITARALRTSHAFHSAMMEPALAPFRDVLAGVTLSPPDRPYISNVSGTWITPQQATSPAYYAEHLHRPVQLEAGMRTMASDPALHFLEVGPGTSLASLARRSLGVDGAHRVVASLRRADDDRDDRESMLEAAGRLWLAGSSIDWRHVHGTPRCRVPLPTYPFERQRYAVDPVGAVPTSPAETPSGARAAPRSSRIDEWFYAPTWTRDDTAPARHAAGRWLVFGDALALTRQICEAMRARGSEPVHIERRVHGDDLPALVRDLPRGGPPLRGAVNLWSLPSPAALSATDTYAWLVALAGALSPGTAGSLTRVLHVTAGAESVLGEPIREPWAALAVGPVLVLPTEEPGLQMRRIDLDISAVGGDPAGVAGAVAAEVTLEGVEPLVAWRAGLRWVRRYDRLALPPVGTEALPFPVGGSCLITGGMGGMGLELARWLARDFGARILLTGRTTLPPREAWDSWLQAHPADERRAAAILAIREIEAAGGAVLVAQADAADQVAMASAIAEARQRFGPLHGVIHAAGVSGRGTVARLADAEDARAVFAPKMQGLEVLVRLLGADPLQFVALMSSINAVTGSPGACDYTSANAVLDAFAASAERPAAWLRVVAINWGAWRDVGMAARLPVADAMRSHWQAHLAGAIAPAAGVDAFSRVLASGRQRVVVDTYDLVRSGERIRHPRLGPADQHTTAADAPPPHRTAAPASSHEGQLVAIWGELLGRDRIGIDDDFFELGGHSLMATRVLSRIDESLGVRLALRDIFDAPTVRALAERVTAAVAAGRIDADAGEREELEF